MNENEAPVPDVDKKPAGKYPITNKAGKMNHPKKRRNNHQTLIAMLAVSLHCLTGNAQPFPDPPAAEISNGLVHAKLLLPDAEKGYYRGTRFDWSGVISEMDYKGHTYFGQWFKKYNPTTNDAIMGPVEAFDPLGYDSAAPGRYFIKIGIGTLIRDDARPYSPFRYYKILDPGKWAVKKSRERIRFIHTLDDHAGYAYRYQKEVKLEKGRPVMLLVHTLKNSGTRVIETDVFDHNFFLLDHLPTAPGLLLKFPFPLRAEEARGLNEIAAIREDSVVILRSPAAHESVEAVLYGYGASEKDYDILLQNRLSGARVRISCDRPLSGLVCWGASALLCPEPYIHISVLPGQTFAWTIKYELSAESQK
ncbi:MAG: hypothetical protein Q8918_14920 [Bacteroidota bacterium]|nr:hypothetical protein [Bacteroidota bacterium]